MAEEQKYGPKAQAIRNYVTANPDATISHVVEALAAGGIQVSPSFVATVQAMLESKTEDATEAESVTVSAPFSEGHPDTERACPAISKWVKDYGWIEIGMQEHQGFVTRALNEGGLVYEAHECETLAEGLVALDEGIRNWLSRQ